MKSILVTAGIWCSLSVVILSACGGDADSGASNNSNDSGSSSSSSSSGSTGQPSGPATPSLNHPASGFYDGDMRVTVDRAVNVNGAASPFTVSVRVVIDPGGGVAVFENRVLKAQARMAGQQFKATSNGADETLLGLSCTGNRTYTANVSGTNAAVGGNFRGDFQCAGGQAILLKGSIDLVRTGSHR